MSFRFFKDIYYLKNFDAYSKPIEDFRIKTLSGAIVSLISGIIIIILAVSELNEYLKPQITQELFVDVTRGQKLPINIDIIFPHIACDYLSLDAMDISGDQQLDVDHEIYKVKLNEKLEPISAAEKHNVTTTVKQSKDSLKNLNGTDSASMCGSCYGAERDDLKCCNTCESVRQAYRIKGWALNSLDNIKQCQEEGWQLKVNSMSKEGCRMHGKITVNKVAGNFHFAPGRSFTQSHVHVHDIQSYGKTQFNISHYINFLSFGDHYPGFTNPLDDLNVKVDELSHMFTYYVKIVPTTYVKLNGSVLHTNQFSVTKYIKPTALSGGHEGLPGIFFNYDINPIMVWIKENDKSFVQFITNLCAIVGGIFTVSSLIDSFIYHSSKVVREKLEAGKLS